MKIIALCLLILLGSLEALPHPSLLISDGFKGENIYATPISSHTVGKPIGERIFGGEEAEPHSKPYQVALLINGRSLCGGSLISRNFVLTAAHCTISASYVELVFGAHNILTHESTQLRVTSSSIINNPRYNAASFSNDISVIKTPSPIVTNNHIQIVKLAPESAGPFDGLSGILSGWGTTSSTNSSLPTGLLQVSLVVMGNEECAKYYGSIIQESTMCTHGFNQVGGCGGDSGGPFVERWYYQYQIGIVSFISSKGCDKGDPTGFSRITSFRKWIDENTDVLDYEKNHS
ncbi:hypothetical protein NQ315_011565 [Exocentrus adspersus]|uniref:Peptidase S1 domain-containing protein n=1 Tax=Exocentrus adspersus TaxID=1586481 RepID=A0AAV8VV57_9CUCU|nr:hypothetical protein NQ315_011565 [Exocentrus adspersus]